MQVVLAVSLAFCLNKACVCQPINKSLVCFASGERFVVELDHLMREQNLDVAKR